MADAATAAAAVLAVVNRAPSAVPLPTARPPAASLTRSPTMCSRGPTPVDAQPTHLRTREAIAALREIKGEPPSGLPVEYPIDWAGFDHREAAVASSLEAFIAILVASFGSLPCGAVSLRKGNNHAAYSGAGFRKEITCVREGKAKTSKGLRAQSSMRCGCPMRFVIEETQDHLVISEVAEWSHNHELINPKAERVAFAHSRNRVPEEIITEARELQAHGTQSAAEIARTLISRERSRRPGEQIDWDTRDFTDALAPDPAHVRFDCNEFAEQLNTEARACGKARARASPSRCAGVGLSTTTASESGQSTESTRSRSST
jgi:hypothetical protein